MSAVSGRFDSARPLLVVLCVAVLAFYMVGDTVSTILTLEAGGVERNPLPRLIIQHMGYEGFVVAKLLEGSFVVGTCLVLDQVSAESLVSARSRSRWVVERVPLVFAVALTAIGIYLTVSNTLVYVAVSGS